MENEDRAEYGLQAIDVGTPDRGANEDPSEPELGIITDASDTIANILHHLTVEGVDQVGIEMAVRIARNNHEAELDGEAQEDNN